MTLLTDRKKMATTIRSKSIVFALVCIMSLPLAVSGCSTTSSLGDTKPSTQSSPKRNLWSGPTVTSTPMSASDAQALDAATATALKSDKDGATGFIIGVWDPVKGFHISSAGLDSRAGSPMGTENHMYIGSITKTITATSILQLVDQGKIKLDATVAEILPDLVKEFPQIAPVKVRQLLNMSSGIPDYVNVDEGGTLPIMWENPYHNFTSRDLIKIALETSPMSDPGTPGYSNTNFIILGEILAKVTGKIPATAINSTLGQLGLAQTLLNPDSMSQLPRPGSAGYYGAEEGKLAEKNGYNYGADTNVSSWNRSWAGTAGGASSTASDLAKFASTGFGTTLLSPTLGKERVTGVTLGDFSALVGLYGLGVGVRGDWLNHAGQLIGWESNAFYNSKTGAVAVLLTNSSSAMASAQPVVSSYFPELTFFWDPTPEEVAKAKITPKP